MKDRIKLIMEKENLTPAKFADRLDINRAVVSHILNGRNNPSLDVVTKILSDMNYINPEWLMIGSGNMYKNGFNENSIPKSPDLFDQNDISSYDKSRKEEYLKENMVNSTYNALKEQDNEMIRPINKPDKKIAQIIIYFDDNTFEIFKP